jgi:heterodisulfide reductase subunit B
VERVARKHDRDDALCCTFSFGRLKPELASKVQDMNLTDAQEHGAEAMAFICPWCQLALRKGCEERALPQIYLVDLCRMALGEKPFRC